MRALKGVDDELTKTKRKIIEFESKLETMVSERLEIKESEWKNELDDRIQVFKER
jgi:hypothetical protein